MQKKETQFRKRAQDDLNTLSEAFFESIQQKAISGTPDKLGCMKTVCKCGEVYGQFVAIEFKSEKGKVSPLQQYKLDKISKAGGIAIAVFPHEWNTAFKKLKDKK